MKLIVISVVFTGFMMLLIECSSPQRPDPEVEACKSACVKKMETCIKRAANNEAKKAACEAVGDKCARECSSKK